MTRPVTIQGEDLGRIGRDLVNAPHPVGVDAYVDPHTSTPKGRFMLRADAIRPYGQRQFSNSACKA